MSGFISGVFNWFSGKSNIPEIPSNIIFEKNVSSDNNFWISCILDPSLEIKYINGVVTQMLDTDICMINNEYRYKPKTDKEIRNFVELDVNSPVRVSLYKKKNSSNKWLVASCYLSKDNGFIHQPAKIVHKNLVPVQVRNNEPTIQVDKNDSNDAMSVQVLGEMPKVVKFEGETIIQILFRNNSYVNEQVLLDYQTLMGNKALLSITNKQKLPMTFGVLSQYTFDITIQGRYLGKSIEKVVFIFKDITYKVGVNIDVTDPRIINPINYDYVHQEIDLQRIFEIQNEYTIPGVNIGKRIQFPYRNIGQWSIPKQLLKCYSNQVGPITGYKLSQLKEDITQLYPAAFEDLTYQNYKAKLHTLLFMEELEITIALQKYAQDRIHFESNGEYLILKISDLSEHRPSLVPGDRALVTDVPNCTKRLGEKEQYEGIIHKVLAKELWLKFATEFHNKCGNWDFNVNFFGSRMIYRKQHDVLNEVWRNSHLGESFLFPFKTELEYQPPKLNIMEDNEINETTFNKDNLDNRNNTLLPQPKCIKIRWFNELLNTEQKSAVINILKGETSPMPYIIYGPPGTGKTVTLTESIIQVYREIPKSRLLICAPTNSAVDLLLSKLIETGLFNKRIMKRLVGYTYYNSLSYNMDNDEYCFFPELESSQIIRPETNSKLIRKNDILKLRIVITTAGTAGLLYMMNFRKGTFSHIFIDEAGQSTEPEILIPLSFLDPYQGGQLILAGDPQQLGPVVLSKLAHSSGLGQSMLARLINYPSYLRDPEFFQAYNGFNPKLITHLIKNYRSLPEIVHNFSKLFYKSLLVAAKVEPSLPERKFLNDLYENMYWKTECKGPVIVHGIIGQNGQEPSSPSWFNPHEAFQVLLYVTQLMKSGISANEIGVITPYSSQVGKINELLKLYCSGFLPKVGTVERFQGQEKTVIIISMVRSKCTIGNEKDKKFNIGFLNTKTRTNVALSRAKSLLIIIANPFTMQTSHEWNYVLSNAIKNNNYIGCNTPEINKQSEENVHNCEQV